MRPATDRALRAAALLALLCAGPVMAQSDAPEGTAPEGVEAPPADAGAPLSDIDWLSDSIEPLVYEPPVATDARAPQVIVTPLDRPARVAIGLLGPSVTGLPRNLWQASAEADLLPLVARDRGDILPALRNLGRVLMLAEAVPPSDATGEEAMLLARIDRLLAMGAVEEAKALIEEAGPETGPLFRRWFDTALLTGDENRACGVMMDRPDIAPTHIAQIFCLARSGDWHAAVLTLNSHRVLGNITPQEEALAARFLDPDLFEGEPPLEAPDRVTPLAFLMHEAIGERLPAQGLPLAFAHADLREVVGRKAQLEAAERLARRGILSENALLDLYTARRPAASGGVWDRAAAVQALDAALAQGDRREVSRLLPEVWGLMRAARLDLPFARLYGERLAALRLAGPEGDLAFRIGLLSPAYLRVAQADPDRAPFLAALARGVPQEAQSETALQTALQEAFSDAPPPAEYAALLEAGKLGEALLRAIDGLGGGALADPRHAGEAIAVLRAAGLEDVARRAALQMLLLDRAL